MFSRILQTVFLSIAPLFLVLILVTNSLTNFVSHKEFLLTNQIYSKLEPSLQKIQISIKAKDMQILAETNLDNVQKWLETTGSLPQIKCQESQIQKEVSQQVAKNFNTPIGDICTNNFNFTEADSYIRGIYQTIKSSQNLIFGFMTILFLGICVLGTIEGRGLFSVISKILTSFGLAMFGYVFGVFMIFGGSLYTTNFLRNSVFPDNFVKELSLVISQNALSFSWQIVSVSVFVALGFFVTGKVLSVFK